MKKTAEHFVYLNNHKIAEDAQLDGLKGYVTNSNIIDKEIVEKYRNLSFT